MKCASCGMRKGKRKCPALRGDICAQCCGEKRVLEIPCTPDCSYLSTGRQHEEGRRFVAMLEQESDPVRRRRLILGFDRLWPLVQIIEAEIVTYARGVPALNDQDVLSALELVLETSRTEAKGIIYEHRSSNPLVQHLATLLSERLKKLREEAAKEGQAVPLEVLVETLELTLSEAGFQSSQAPEDRSFLRALFRKFPEIYQESGGQRGGIIVASS